MSKKHGSLFSGIGGFDLAAEWMGWDNVFHCECNEFGQKILKHYWPNAKSYGDIKQTDFSIHRGEIDILTGGFPCQPYSTAGKRKGKEDDRHLWPEMLRAIREIQPSWIVGENVYGLVNWSGGLVFGEVQTNLEAEGYEVFPYVLPACAVNAPHRRDRVWFVAYSNSNGSHGNKTREEGFNLGERRNALSIIDGDGSEGIFTDTNNDRLQRGEKFRSVRENRKNRNKFFTGLLPSNWKNFPTESPICGGNDGLPSELAGITVSKHRKESLMAYGNAIVPQVALQIFKAIEAYEKTTLTKADKKSGEGI